MIGYRVFGPSLHVICFRLLSKDLVLFVTAIKDAVKMLSRCEVNRIVACKE